MGATALARPCHVDGGWSVHYHVAVAYDDTGGLFAAATHDDSVGCDGGPNPIWTLDPSGSVAARTSHAFGRDAQFVGGRGGFVAIEVEGRVLRASWMLLSGEVVSTRPVAEAEGLTVRAVHAVRVPDAPRGLAAVWIQTLDAAGYASLHAVTPEGETLWSLPWNGFPRIDLVAPGADGDATVIGPGRLVRVDASGTIAWDRTYPAESWETIQLRTIASNPDGGYWAVGRVYGGNFSHLLVLDLDAAGLEIRRRAHFGEEAVDKVIWAQALDGALAVLLSVTEAEQTPERYLRPYLRSARLDADAIAIYNPLPLVPAYLDSDLIDLGAGRFLQARGIYAYGCLNGSGGCVGDLGVAAQPVQIKTVLRTP